jgi:hypothetical protein
MVESPRPNTADGVPIVLFRILTRGRLSRNASIPTRLPPRLVTLVCVCTLARRSCPMLLAKTCPPTTREAARQGGRDRRSRSRRRQGTRVARLHTSPMPHSQRLSDGRRSLRFAAVRRSDWASILDPSAPCPSRVVPETEGSRARAGAPAPHRRCRLVAMTHAPAKKSGRGIYGCLAVEAASSQAGSAHWAMQYFCICAHTLLAIASAPGCVG